MDTVGKKVGSGGTNIRDMETASGIKLKLVYTPEDAAVINYKTDVGNGGEYPYVRAFYPPAVTTRPTGHGESDYQPYMGVGTSQDTRARFEYLRSLGITDVNFALDLPTQMGVDSDDPRAYGEVGRVGIAIDTLRDMEDFFEGINLGNVSTNMTINATAVILYAMYFAVAQKQGVPLEKLEGTPQNDIIKEYTARGAWVLDIEPAVKLGVDLAEWCVRHSPLMHPISNCGGHYGQSGATLTQQMAFAFETQRVYIDQLLERGLTIDDLGRPLTFLSVANGGNEVLFFESIAATRAARRMWAKMMKDEYGAKNPRTMRLLRENIGAGTNTCTTGFEPECNIVRGACVGVSDQLISPRAPYGHGGATGDVRYEGAFAIPTEVTHRLNNLQRKVIRECAQVNVVDPLAGSYYIEALSNEAEKGALKWIEEIRKHGGMIKAVKDGFIQQIVSRAAFTFHRQLQTGEKVKIGVNRYPLEEEKTREPEYLRYDWTIHARQIAKVNKVKAERDSSQVERTLAALREAAIRTKKDRKINLMPLVMDCVKAYATVGEIFRVFREEYGEFRQPSL